MKLKATAGMVSVNKTEVEAIVSALGDAHGKYCDEGKHARKGWADCVCTLAKLARKVDEARPFELSAEAAQKSS